MLDFWLMADGVILCRRDMWYVGRTDVTGDWSPADLSRSIKSKKIWGAERHAQPHSEHQNCGCLCIFCTFNLRSLLPTADCRRSSINPPQSNSGPTIITVISAKMLSSSLRFLNQPAVRLGADAFIKNGTMKRAMSISALDGFEGKHFISIDKLR